MKIALGHDQTIPPKKYGGTERAIAWLAKHLIQLGHEVTLIAGAGSHIEGARFIEHQKGASFEEQTPKEIDVLHVFTTPHAEPRRPYLVTIEGNGREGERFWKNTTFVSRKHAENHGAHSFVYNGTEVDEYPCDSQRKETLVFLAKASWAVKNLEGAIQVARKVGMRLEVMGSRDWPGGLHRWVPTVRGVKYHGMVGDLEKREILRTARALLFPVRWHEPFGIAITEALASGCAVFGTPYGSLPEIVTPEVGYLGTSATELSQAIRQRLDSFTPEKCRAHAASAPFSARAMTENYLKLYDTILRTGVVDPRQAERPPQTLPGLSGLSAASLLPWSV